jgi:hypothetical protein
MLVIALLVLLVAAVVGLGYLWRKLKEANQHNKDLQTIAQSLHREGLSERLQRWDYERALGLPLHSEEQLERDLWARSAQGDELAKEVLESRCLRELRREIEDLDQPLKSS